MSAAGGHKRPTRPAPIRHLVVLTVALVWAGAALPAATVAVDPDELREFLDQLLEKELTEQNIPGAVVVIVQGDRTLLKRGYGFADLEKKSRVDPDKTLFRVGSITKTFTALAAMVLVERGSVELHEDVNRYLKTVTVPATFRQSVTLAHLLSHTAGFDELPGRLVFSSAERIPLDRFLRDRLTRVRPPGQAPAYSSYGIALAGLLVEQVADASLEGFLHETVWGPLRMDRTWITIPGHLTDDTAVGYEYRNGSNEAQPWEWYHTYPASEISSTGADMGRYMSMYLQGGSLEETRIIGEGTMRAMLERQSTGHPGINGFGYGFVENQWSGQRTMEHGGDMRGFSAYMVLVPDQDTGIFLANHHEGSRLRYRIVSALMERYFSADLARFEGRYAWMSECLTCPDEGQRTVWEVTANPDGTLSMIGKRWIRIEPLLFLSSDGVARVGFKEDGEGKISHMFLGNVDAFIREDLLENEP